MNNFKQYIRGIHSISDLDFNEGAKLFSFKELEKGDYFVKQGETCKEIGYVDSGTMRVFALDSSGIESTTCFCIANKMTSSYKSFSRNEPSNFAIQAIENTRLLTITKRNLETLYATNDSWSTIGRKLLETEYLMMEDYAVMLNREAAKEKYKKLMHEMPQVLRVATINEIASYLGVNRRTVTRIREEILKEK